jgi:antitoxin (DNA-binding transcriptional repressor) of toxin-antitoxin stability system
LLQRKNGTGAHFLREPSAQSGTTLYIDDNPKRYGARNRKTKTCWSRYACEMAVLHMTEAELARNLALVLDHVQSGTEVIIERNDRPVAVLRPTQPSWRKLSEIKTALPERSAATLDADFVAEVQEFIDRHSAALLSY